jgi:hypothetical protein
MKKQKLIHVSRNGGDPEGENSIRELMKQIDNFIIFSYVILFITAIILFCKFIYKLKSRYLLSLNKQAVCSGGLYENETLRNQMYMVFKDTTQKDNFQNTYKILFILIVLLTGLLLLLNRYLNNESRYVLSPTSFMCILSLIIITIGFYLSSKTLNKLYTSSADYASKVATLKATIFTNEKLNQLAVAYQRQLTTASTPASTPAPAPASMNKILTCGSLVSLEENINRRLLHTNESDDVQTTGDANFIYNSLRSTDIGQDKLIGYIQFTRNSDDYNLLQSAICGENICSDKGIGKRLTGLSTENYAAFMIDLANLITSADANESYSNLLTIFIAKVATYDTVLASDLKDMLYNDTTWTYLKQLQTQNISQSNIPPCDCRGNPLNLANKDKQQVLSILNYLATLSNGDPTVEIQKIFDSLQIFLIVASVYISYIIFHSIYTMFDKKIVIGSYFGLLLFIAIILGLSARLH